MVTRTSVQSRDNALAMAFFLVVPAMLMLTYWVATFGG